MHVKEALRHLEAYNTDQRFKDALELLSAVEGIEAKATIDALVNGFLKDLQINQKPSPTELASMGPEQVLLFGETYHFARKFFQTSYDIENGSKTVFPAIQAVFDAATGIGILQSANLLGTISGLSTKSAETQKRIVTGVIDIVGKINLEYESALNVAEAEFGAKSDNYRTTKAKIDAKKMTLLGYFGDFLSDKVTLYIDEPTAASFEKYLKKEKKTDFDFRPNGDDSTRTYGYVAITRDYFAGLARLFGRNTVGGVRKLLEDVREVLGVDWNANRERSVGSIIFYTGNMDNPTRHSVKVSKGSVTGNEISLLTAVCDYVLRKKELPVNFRAMTTKARESFISYLGGK